jgi:hypothetical protein
LAVFTTIAIAAANTRAGGGADAFAYGYTTAFVAGEAMLVTAAVVVNAAVNTKRTQAAAGALI